MAICKGCHRASGCPVDGKSSRNMSSWHHMLNPSLVLQSVIFGSLLHPPDVMLLSLHILSRGKGGIIICGLPVYIKVSSKNFAEKILFCWTSLLLKNKFSTSVNFACCDSCFQFIALVSSVSLHNHHQQSKYCEHGSRRIWDTLKLFFER